MAEEISGGEIPNVPQQVVSTEKPQTAPSPKILPRIERSIQKGENSLEIAEETRGEGEIGYEELSPGLKQALSESQFNELVAQSFMRDVEETERHMDYQTGLYPQAESGQFKEEIEHPNHRLDPETGINYAVTWLNKESTGKPLVVKLYWSAGANSRTARSFLSAISAKTERPIVVIDSAATGGTSIPGREWMKQATFDSMADSEKRVLDEELAANGLEDSHIDLLGISMGGIQAAKLAERYGSRVDKLITFSTPGFVKRNPLKFALGFSLTEQDADKKIIEEEDLGIKENREFYDAMFGKLGINLDREKLPGLYKVMPRLLKILKPAFSDFSGLLPPEQFSSEQVPAFFRFYHLMTRAPLADLPKRLDNKTQWIDVIGSADAITDSADHLEAVRERNKTLRYTSSGRTRGERNYNFLHTSSVHILGSDPHSWIAISTEVAEKAAGFLKGAGIRESA